MAEYVKSLITEEDISEGRSYEVIEYEYVGLGVYVRDNVGDKYYLLKSEYERIDQPSNDTSQNNPFIREETVIKRTLCGGCVPIGEEGAFEIFSQKSGKVEMSLDRAVYTKAEVTELARIFKEISEVME